MSPEFTAAAQSEGTGGVVQVVPLQSPRRRKKSGEWGIIIIERGGKPRVTLQMMATATPTPRCQCGETGDDEE
jgi:hypothetical protein